MVDENYSDIYVGDNGKEGYLIKGKDAIMLDAPELLPSPDTPLLTEAQDLVGAINELSGHPVKSIYNDSDDTITESWQAADEIRTVQYKITVTGKGTDNEAVTAITFPDGTIMSLEGF